ISALSSPESSPVAPLPDAASLVAPAPLVSRGKQVTGSSSVRYSKPANAIDGDHATAWTAGKPTPEQPAWIAIEVGKGPARVLLNWSASGSFNYDETDYGSPGAYRIETSADSTDGEDGTWKGVASAPGVGTHGREHSFDFVGRSWVRLV